MSLAVWEKVVADFPEEQSLIFRSIRDTMAHKAAVKNHGKAMSSPEMVRMSPLLRYLSDATIQALAKRFEPVVVKPFAEIVTKGRADGVMCLQSTSETVKRSVEISLSSWKSKMSKMLSMPRYILLSGSVYVEAGRRRRDYNCGHVFGEAEALGVSKAYNNTIVANNLCILSVPWAVLGDRKKQRMVSVLETDLKPWWNLP